MPRCFPLLETWADQSPETSGQAALTTEMLGKLDSIRTSDLTCMAYNPGGWFGRAANNNAIYIVAPSTRPEASQSTGLLRQLAEASRNDDGNLRFDVLQRDAPESFHRRRSVAESEGLDVHARPAFQTIPQCFGADNGSPIDQRLYKTNGLALKPRSALPISLHVPSFYPANGRRRENK